jgi:hypothetical protein
MFASDGRPGRCRCASACSPSIVGTDDGAPLGERPRKRRAPSDEDAGRHLPCHDTSFANRGLQIDHRQPLRARNASGQRSLPAPLKILKRCRRAASPPRLPASSLSRCL